MLVRKMCFILLLLPVAYDGRSLRHPPAAICQCGDALHDGAVRHAPLARGKYYFAAGVLLFEIAMGLGGLGQGERSADHHLDPGGIQTFANLR